MHSEGSSSSSASSAPGYLEAREKSKLFEIIDKFRDLGINEDISLPQLVVVGDQSSGKSSLLEALTRLPFPVAGNICTRFATQIVFRRTAPDEDETVKATIIPSENSTEDYKTAIREWTYDIGNKLTAEVFKKLLISASEAMGLPIPGEIVSLGSARFSDDLLKIELAGPHHSHFSVVDIPGIFQTATVHQSLEDVVLVEQLVKKYLHDSRTIILAVASSLHETANQKVFTLAKEADQQGIRTLGVLTKPDAVQKGDEARIIDVALNRVTILTHGWFVVRNRSTADITDNISLDQRNRTEAQFFSQRPWNKLPADRVGINALNKFLRELLDEHVKKEFPKLLQEMNTLIEVAEKELDVLGPKRESPDEQRRVLLKLATQYQNIAINAILGNYTDYFFDQNTEHKLRKVVANYNDEFAKTMSEDGHQVDFDLIEDDKITNTPGLQVERPIIYDIICDSYHENRGAELPGMVNPIVVQNLFRYQTKDWENLSKQYIDRVYSSTKTFINALLKYVCPDTSLESRISARMSLQIQHAFDRGINELRSILASERDGVLLTLDEVYGKELQEARKTRQWLALRKIKQPPSSIQTQNLEAWLRHVLNNISISNEEQSVNDIHDILRAYYIVARGRFVDNVATQVVERHFLSKDGGSASEKGPVMYFSPQWVGELTTEELDMVAGEDIAVARRRTVLMDKLQKWRKAKEFAEVLW